MASPFAEAAAMVSETIADVFGEALRLEARGGADPNGRQTTDPDRAAFTIKGAFSTPSTIAKAPGRTLSGNHLHDMVRQCPSAVLHGPLPWRPRKGDRLVRIENDRAYEIAEVHSLPHHLIRLELVA